MSKRKAQPVSLPPVVKSCRALAKRCGKSLSAVRKWTRHADWPVSRTPPWSDGDLVRIDAFRTLLHRDPAGEYRTQIAAADGGTGEFAGMPAERRARVSLLVERALRVRQQREIAAGKLIERTLAEEQRLRQIHHVSNIAQSWPSSVRDMLAQKSAEEVERILTGLVAELLRTFAGETTVAKAD